MIQTKNNSRRYKKLKPEIIFSIKDILIGVSIEVLYMAIFIAILFIMTTLL